MVMARTSLVSPASKEALPSCSTRSTGYPDPLDKLAAQAEDEMMPESRQRQLGTQRDRHQQQ